MRITADTIIAWMQVLKTAKSQGDKRVVFYHPTHSDMLRNYATTTSDMASFTFEYVVDVGWQCPLLNLIITTP